MKHTNKPVLYKGIKYLALALPLAIIGPSILFSAFNNQDHPLYYGVLILGSIAAIGAVYCMFKGILTIIRAVFD